MTTIAELNSIFGRGRWRYDDVEHVKDGIFRSIEDGSLYGTRQVFTLGVTKKKRNLDPIYYVKKKNQVVVLRGFDPSKRKEIKCDNTNWTEPKRTSESPTLKRKLPRTYSWTWR